MHSYCSVVASGLKCPRGSSTDVVSKQPEATGGSVFILISHRILCFHRSRRASCLRQPDCLYRISSWAAMVLPYLDQVMIANQYSYDVAWSALSNRPLVSTQLPVFQCPTSPSGQTIDQNYVVGAAVTDYGAVHQVQTRVFAQYLRCSRPKHQWQTGFVGQGSSESST